MMDCFSTNPDCGGFLKRLMVWPVGMSGSEGSEIVELLKKANRETLSVLD